MHEIPRPEDWLTKSNRLAIRPGLAGCFCKYLLSLRHLNPGALGPELPRLCIGEVARDPIHHCHCPRLDIRKHLWRNSAADT